MPIRKKKISDLTLADSLKGLYTIGYKVVDGVKISVKVGLEYIQVAYEDVVQATRDAIAAAKAAFDAAIAADTSRESIEANEAEREDNEEARKLSEQERAAAETQRATAENGRDTAEKARVSEFSKIKTDAEKATGDAIIATGKTNEAIHNAEVATDTANVATASANQAAIEANQSADTADAKAQAAQEAAASANDTANHPTYIGTDHYVYKWNKVTSAYDKTDIYTKGDAFSIKKVYASVAALQSDVNNTDIAEGDFVLVNTNDVENPDNAKLYVKVKNSDGTFSYSFLVDMSGAIGFTGKTPQFSMGNISTLEAGSTATVTVSEDGTDSDGNPKYRINFAIPRGNPGAPFNPVGQYDTFELLKAAVPDGANINGMIAVGTEAPYEYYAWLNCDWVNQGKIAGGGDGRMIIIPNTVLALTKQSSGAEILDAFGSKDAFIGIVDSIENGAPAAVDTPNGNIILAQSKGKANVYEVGEPGFDLTNFELFNSGSSYDRGDIVEYTNKKIRIENAYDVTLTIKDISSLQIDGTIILYVTGGFIFDGIYTWDGGITAEYGNTDDNYMILVEDKYLDNPTNNSEYSWDLTIPMYKDGLPLKRIYFSNHGDTFYATITTVDGVSNHYLSFTYLDPTSLDEGKKYSFYLEDGVITLSKVGTGFGFAEIANILYKNNTTPYTPTGDYHPATKKYVDDKKEAMILDVTGYDEAKILTAEEILNVKKWVASNSGLIYKSGTYYQASYYYDESSVVIEAYYISGGDQGGYYSINIAANIIVNYNDGSIMQNENDKNFYLIWDGNGNKALFDDGSYKQAVQSDEVQKMKKLSQAQYDALATKDNSILYIIIG